MTKNLYRNILASIRWHLYETDDSLAWYLDRKNSNMTEDTFVELRSSMGRRQHELKAYEDDFLQVMVFAKAVEDLDELIGEFYEALDSSSGKIPVMDYIGEATAENPTPETELGALQIERLELSPQTSASEYAVQAITAYYSLIDH